MENQKIIIICIIIFLGFIVGIAGFVQGLILFASSLNNKKAILDDLKKYDEESYFILVNTGNSFSKKIIKLIFRLMRDKELKNTNKTLYRYVRGTKIFLWEMLIFVVLWIIGVVIIKIFGKSVA